VTLDAGPEVQRIRSTLAEQAEAALALAQLTQLRRACRRTSQYQQVCMMHVRGRAS
jgi:hypothetical protein